MSTSIVDFYRGEPVFGLCVAELSTVCENDKILEQDPVFIRGQKSYTKESFFAEISAALQFPWFFGNNWSALEDCLKDFLVEPDYYSQLIFLAATELFTLQPYNLKIFLEVLLRAVSANENNKKIIFQANNSQSVDKIVNFFAEHAIELVIISID